MAKRYDFQKEWEKAKEQLMDFSRDALNVIKKGEEEVARLSRKGKLHLDTGALSLRREHLYYVIGKEYIRAKCPGSPTERLKKLLAEFADVTEEIKGLNRKIKNVK